MCFKMTYYKGSICSLFIIIIVEMWHFSCPATQTNRKPTEGKSQSRVCWNGSRSQEVCNRSGCFHRLTAC